MCVFLVVSTNYVGKCSKIRYYKKQMTDRCDKTSISQFLFVVQTIHNTLIFGAKVILFVSFSAFISPSLPLKNNPKIIN